MKCSVTQILPLTSPSPAWRTVRGARPCWHSLFLWSCYSLMMPILLQLIKGRKTHSFEVTERNLRQFTIIHSAARRTTVDPHFKCFRFVLANSKTNLAFLTRKLSLKGNKLDRKTGLRISLAPRRVHWSTEKPTKLESRCHVTQRYRKYRCLNARTFAFTAD